MPRHAEWPACTASLTRGRHQNPRIAKPAEVAGLHGPKPEAEFLAEPASGKSAFNASPDLPRAKYVRGEAASERVLLHPGGILCSHSSPSPSTCTVPCAVICTGRCRTWSPSLIDPANAGRASGPSPASPERRAARCRVTWHNLAKDGIISRQRRPGGVYAYTIAARFLPAARGVSHRREKGVPRPRTEEQEGKNTTGAQARFGKSGAGDFSRTSSFGELPDERIKWEARLRSWRKSGFWLPSFGPKPGEIGCFAPAQLTG